MNRCAALLLWSLTGCGLAPVEERVLGPTQPSPVDTTLVDLTPVELRREPTPPARPAPEVPNEVQSVLSDVTTWIDLELNESTVFCSALGYGLSFLKVSIPQLDQLAHFDHRVEESGLPCAAVGECSSEVGPHTILAGGAGVERVAVRVVLTEVLRLDPAARTCTRQLVEEVFATVRGVPLRHREQDKPAPMRFDVCMALAVP